MSILGDVARLDPQELAALRSDAARAYATLSNGRHVARLDLDMAWDVLRFLLDAVDAPVNPISGGDLYPDEKSAWGYAGDSRALTVEQVRRVAEFVRAVPFSALAAHFPAASRADLYGGRALDSPAGRDRIGRHYADLVDFFVAAASAGQRTVFWAA